MNEEERKKILGEFYIDIENCNLKKNEICDIITRFINNGSFMPILDENTISNNFSSSKISYDIRLFARTNHYGILNPLLIFYDIPTTLKDYRYGEYINDIYMLNCNGVKKIFIKRNRKPFIDIESSTITKKTMLEIYKCAVYNILDYKLVSRRLKEIINIVEDYSNKYIVLTNPSNKSEEPKSVEIFRIFLKSINKNLLLLNLRLNVERYDLKTVESTKYVRSKELHGIKDVLKYFDNLKKTADIIDINDRGSLVSLINDKINQRIEFLIKKREELPTMSFCEV